MAEKESFFKRVRRALSPKGARPDAFSPSGPPAGEESPSAPASVAGAMPEAGVQAPGRPEPPRAIPAADPLHVQFQQALDRLATLPEASREVAAALRDQVSLNERLQDVLKGLAEPDQDLLHAMQDLASESTKQTDLLTALKTELARNTESGDDAAGALARLPELLENFNRSNASHIQLMEQLRDRLADTRDSTAEELVHLGQKIGVGLLAVIVLLAGLIVAVLVRGR